MSVDVSERRDPFTLLQPSFQRAQAFRITPSFLQDKAGNTRQLVMQIIDLLCCIT